MHEKSPLDNVYTMTRYKGPQAKMITNWLETCSSGFSIAVPNVRYLFIAKTRIRKPKWFSTSTSDKLIFKIILPRIRETREYAYYTIRLMMHNATSSI